MPTEINFGYSDGLPSGPRHPAMIPHSKARKLSSFLIVAGLCLLVLYAVPTLYGSAMAHLAVLQFRRRSSTNRLWDSARIHAYRRTLSVSFTPPEAILHIPKLSLDVPVLEGTSDLTLNRGVGRILGTAHPGQPGNLAIAGHRDGFFRPLKDLALGDLIEVEQPGRHTDRYTVRNIKIISPADNSVLKPTPDPTLTLVTCYPFYYVGPAPQRYIVQATLLATSPSIAPQEPTHVAN